MYKFFGKKNETITSSVSGQPIFRFSSKGEFITDDKDIINRAKKHFDYLEIKVESVGERIKVVKEQSAITIEVREE